jgi:hypothetical protein
MMQATASEVDRQKHEKQRSRDQAEYDHPAGRASIWVSGNTGSPAGGSADFAG